MSPIVINPEDASRCEKLTADRTAQTWEHYKNPPLSTTIIGEVRLNTKFLCL